MISSPVWFWLIATTAIPIAVHLWNRKSGSSQLFGAFRFLPEESFAKAGRIELHEIPLLLIRILLVLTLVLLLAELFWMLEPETVHTVKITESETGQHEINRDENVLQMSVSPDELNSAGWWNIIAQADADYHPELILAEGHFSKNRFKGIRPELSADVEWVERSAENPSVRAAWRNADGTVSAFVQQEAGTRNQIETVENNEILLSPDRAVVAGDTVAFFDSVTIQIKANAEPELREGLEYAAEWWNLQAEIQPMGELARVVTGDQSFSLIQVFDEEGPRDIVLSNSTSGMNLPVSNLDTKVYADKSLLRSRNLYVPVFWESAPGEVILNGKFEKPLQPWILAGAGHQLISKSLDIKPGAFPVLDAGQRNVRTSESSETGKKEPQPLRGILFMMLLGLWVAERMIAPARGM